MSDPVWLPDVLRAAGLTCDIYPDALDRGHGDFGDIWGIVIHHTGAAAGSSPGPAAIAEHPTLGLAAQLYLSRDGKYTLCGVGIAWHAGQGAWPGLPTNDANRVTIGIEAENSGTEGWSMPQYNAYVSGVAAILRKLGRDASHVIGHKEWAGPAQGKWDPGLLDMDLFRREVQVILDRKPGGNDVDQATGDKIVKLLSAFLDQFSGPGTAAAVIAGKPGGFGGWPQNGNRTFNDTIAAAVAVNGVPGAYDVKKASK